MFFFGLYPSLWSFMYIFQLWPAQAGAQPSMSQVCPTKWPWGMLQLPKVKPMVQPRLTRTIGPATPSPMRTKTTTCPMCADCGTPLGYITLATHHLQAHSGNANIAPSSRAKQLRTSMPTLLGSFFLAMCFFCLCFAIFWHSPTEFGL